MFAEFEKFINYSPKSEYNEEVDEITNFFELFGGNVFKDGLITVFKKDDIDKWKTNIYETYPNLKSHEFIPFAHDWLGCVFALNVTQNCVTMFEIYTSDIVNMPCDLKGFCEDEVINYGDDCLAITNFNNWIANNKPLNYDECLTYKIPLFLSGDDDESNTEVSDIDVYWHILSGIIGN